MLSSERKRLVWKGRSVFVTGHTGFKGGWLSIWLSHLGSKVHGYALNPPTVPSLCEEARIPTLLSSDTRADLRNLEDLTGALTRSQAEVIFHIAAQPSVRESYRDPLGTLGSNVVGTAHLLEAARTVDSVRAIVVVATDKVYENREWVYPYRELDPLGGHDLYSASKAAAELVTASYRSSFFSNRQSNLVRIASARAGNVLGGGDWTLDRLVPDCFRAFEKGDAVRLRYPNAVRPWQHVLEPLGGYMLLAERLLEAEDESLSKAWNFGAEATGDATVAQVADMVVELWGRGAKVIHAPSSDHPHEAGILRLDSNLARTELGWKPRWSLRATLERTVTWQLAWKAGEDMRAFSVKQVQEYISNDRPL